MNVWSFTCDLIPMQCHSHAMPFPCDGVPMQHSSHAMGIAAVHLECMKDWRILCNTSVNLMSIFCLCLNHFYRFVHNAFTVRFEESFF